MGMTPTPLSEAVRRLMLESARRKAAAPGPSPVVSGPVSSYGMFGAEEGPQPDLSALSEIGAGITEIPAGLAKIIWQSQVDKWNSLLPASVSPNSLLPAGLQGKDPTVSGLNLGQRIHNYIDAKTLGGVSDFERLEEETRRERAGKELTAGEGLWRKVLAGGKMAVEGLTPVPEARTLLTGKVREGVDAFSEPIEREATTKDFTMAMASGLMKSVPLAALASRAFSGSFVRGLGKNPNAKLSRTMTANELKDPMTIGRLMDEKLTESGFTPRMSELGQVAAAEDAPRISYADFSKVIGRTMQSKIYDTIWKETRATDPAGLKTQVSDILKSVIEDPRGLDPDTLAEIAVKYDLPLEQVTSEVAKFFRDETTVTGLMQQQLSAAELISRGRAWMDAQAGDPVARDAIRAVGEQNLLNRRIDVARGEAKVRAASAKPPTFSERVMSVAERIENARRIALAGIQVATTNRNNKAFVFNNAFRSLADRITARTFGIDPDDADSRPSGFHYEYIERSAQMLEASADVGPWWKAFDPRERAARIGRGIKDYRETRRDILAELPFTTGRMFDNMSFDVTAGSLKGFLADWDHKNYRSKLDYMKGVLTSYSRLAEVQTRQIRFFSKLERHAKRLGYEDLHGVREVLRRESSIPDDLRYAIADAEVDALKTTFGYRYSTGLAGATLDAYAKLYPFSTMFTTPFPRFVVNSWKMLEETSPHHWMHLFNKDFREILGRHAKNDFATYEARETLARGLGSALQLSVALGVRSGAFSGLGIKPGPEYHEYSAPGMEEGKYESLKQFAPLDRWFAVADGIIKTAKGANPKDIFTPNQIWDFATMTQRYDDMVILDIPNIMRTFASRPTNSFLESVAETTGKVAGEYFSGFTVPLNTVKELEGGITQIVTGEDINPATARRDTNTVGPPGAILGNLPHAGGFFDQAMAAFIGLDPNTPNLSNALRPYRVSMWTGEVEHSADPFYRMLGGTTTRKVSKLQYYIESTPGLDSTQIHTTFSNPRATQRVDAIMGALLQGTHPWKNRPELDKFSEKSFLARLEPEGDLGQLTPEARNWVLMTELKELRSFAVERAKAENPEWFSDETIDGQNIPPSVKRLLKRVLPKTIKDAKSPAGGR